MGKARAFTTLPVAAIGDKRLSALDLRCLAVIALHDGMSLVRGKGAGCYASHATLAKLLGTDITSFSRALSRLEQFGYVVRERQEQDRRRQTTRVVYPAGDSWQEGQVSATSCPEEMVGNAANYTSEMVGEFANETGEILDNANSETRRNPPKNGPDYIPLNGEIDAENQRIDSIEMASQFATRDEIDSVVVDLSDRFRSPEGQGSGTQKKRAEARAARVSLYPHLPRTFQSLPPAAQLSQIDRALKAIGNRVDLLPRDEVQFWQEFLLNVEDSAIATDERGARVSVMHWAQRISVVLAA